MENQELYLKIAKSRLKPTEYIAKLERIRKIHNVDSDDLDIELLEKTNNTVEAIIIFCDFVIDRISISDNEISEYINKAISIANEKQGFEYINPEVLMFEIGIFIRSDKGGCLVNWEELGVK